MKEVKCSGRSSTAVVTDCDYRSYAKLYCSVYSYWMHLAGGGRLQGRRQHCSNVIVGWVSEQAMSLACRSD